MLYWLAAWWLRYPWLAVTWLLFLFGENQFIVAGDSEAICYAVMQDDDFVQTVKEFAAGDSFLCHAGTL